MSLGNPVLTLLTETHEFQKEIGSVITAQELPKTIRKQ